MMVRALKGSWRDDYEVRVAETHTPWGFIRHVRVWRHDKQDGITWDVLQAIKNEVLGSDVTAVEVYPATDRLVDGENMRHLWEIPDHYALPFGLP